MTKAILEFRNVSIRYKDSDKLALHPLNLKVRSGESVGIVGESGSGKTSVALAIMGLLQGRANVEGDIIFMGEWLNAKDKSTWEGIRWNRVSLVFQNASNILNPMMKVLHQVAEPMLKKGRRQAHERASKLLEEVGLEALWWEAYPGQLSGGMRQKVLIAMALACEPELLIVDEPTMALDPMSKLQIINLLKTLQKRHRFGMIVISHEMKLIEALCKEVYVLYRGHHLEFGKVEEVMKTPRHPYSKGLVGASWEIDAYRDIWGIPNYLRESVRGGCPFYSRCFQAVDACRKYDFTPLEIENGQVVACKRGGIATLLDVRGITKSYKVGKQKFCAVNQVSFEVAEGEVLTLIGASGSGKSTIASVIAGIQHGDEGVVRFRGKEIEPLHIMRERGGVQLVVQDPDSAMNANWKVFDILYEPMKWNLNYCKKGALKHMKQMLRAVQLDDDEGFLQLRAGQLSGGEKQRIAIARALLMSPKLLIADEVSAMLDPSNAANLVKMLKEMQNKLGFSMIYITHDLYLARKISDKTVILERGCVKQYGESSAILDDAIESIEAYAI